MIGTFSKKIKNAFITFAVLSGLFSCEEKHSSQNLDWRYAGGDQGVSRYSPLDQINKGNVKRLKIAWIFHSNDNTQYSTIECNPIIIKGVLYGTTPLMSVVALNAVTGEKIWRFNPYKPGASGGGVNRGIAYWNNGPEGSRILFSAGNKLYALNAVTGRPIQEFGLGGYVDMRYGLDRPVEKVSISAPAASVIYKNLVIMGSMGAAPGDVRAYNVITGKMEWTFHTIPHPGEYGAETWSGDAWKTLFGANVWGGMSIDETRGIVFFATGSPKDNFYGGIRVGDNLYANSVVALDANTGKRIWHFQELHHDIWDLDLPCPPNLVTVTIDGKKIDVVAQVGKRGYTYVFERETGKPLFPIEERSVQATSELVGEVPSPTQPYPVKPAPFCRQVVTENDLTDLTPEAHEEALTRFRESKTGSFVPMSLQSTIYFGIHGGAEWTGAAVDPNGILYVNSNEIPWIITMQKLDAQKEGESAISGKQIFLSKCAVCHKDDRKGSGNYPPLLNIKNKYPEDKVKETIKKGRGQMPSFSNLSKEQLDALVNFLFDKENEHSQSRPHFIETKVSNDNPPYYFKGFNKFLDQEGYPAVKPPWGTLNAIDLNKGELLWQVPLGEYDALTKKGIPVTGTENFGGTIVTAGGLLFIGGTRDEKFRAFDKQTGKILWETQLPAGGFATPSTYMVNGKQYVVIAAGGGGKLGTKSGDMYISFTLGE
jgi:quinoprotein glucose dehydrogenase